MKTISMLSVAALLVSGWITSHGQDIDPEVPGDHFSLEGALELFKKSSSPEEFEKMLNSPESKVNNLDLNGDGYIDYIRVHDRYDGNVHAFIIQAVISENELQDVAVIELEKLGNGKAVLQIIGDEDVYGVTTIIEPTQEVRTYAGTQTTRALVNVWTWPSVQYIYSPYYTVWVSPWTWYHRPVWWHTWRPVAYVHYYHVWRPYHHHYVYCHTRRIARAYHIYHPYRTTSVVVRDRHHDKIHRYRSAHRYDDRNGRTREEVRRTYARDDRSSTHGTDAYQRRRPEEANRRTLPREEANPSQNHSMSRERSVPIQRNLSEQRKEETMGRRPATVSNSRESRQYVNANPPAMHRRQIESPVVQPRRTTTTERTVPADYRRASPQMSRENYSNRRPAASNNDRAIRQEVLRSSGHDRGSSHGGQRQPDRSSHRSAQKQHERGRQ